MAIETFVKPDKRAQFDEHQASGKRHTAHQFFIRMTTEAYQVNVNALMNLLTGKTPGVGPQA
jgi:hypothetical protein